MAKALTITIFFLVSTLAYSLYTDGRNPALDKNWFIYKSTFNKRHVDSMDSLRRMTWETNLKYVEKHNLDADLHKHSFHLGMNEYGDLTNKEFTTHTFPTIESNMSVADIIQNKTNSTDLTDLPESIDWQKKGYVTSVKIQKYCGSCAHMAAVGGYESAFYKKTKILVSFSVQQMVNCVNHYGCRGAVMNDILELIKTKGIQADSVIPYVARPGDCIYDTNYNIDNLREYQHIMRGERSNDEHVIAMKNAVANVGPLIATMDGSSLSFSFYKFGIYEYTECSQTNHNHAVVIVGYSDNSWRFKNSWGPHWGRSGFGNIAIGKNVCGVEDWTRYIIA